VSDPARSRQARALAERALVRLVRAYGDVPEFVLLGGLVPDLLCSSAAHRHVGTTDVDLQVDLAIHGGSVNASRLEHALKKAGFGPETARVWRWKDKGAPGMVVKVEFLADLDDVANQQVVVFDDCESLGAVNLRGTGFASQDWEVRAIAADLDGQKTTVSLRVATLPAYLLAKVHAAHGRALTKDWYDVAYVLLHNDDGGPIAAARRVRDRFGAALVGSTETALGELAANFVDATAQGSDAYATIMSGLHTELDSDVLANDAVSAVIAFVTELPVDGR
jgi:Nucleotidyl transferase AbiEii toxin, Type IV TA system